MRDLAIKAVGAALIVAFVFLVTAAIRAGFGFGAIMGHWGGIELARWIANGGAT
jgi:hypothetical protein